MDLRQSSSRRALIGSSLAAVGAAVLLVAHLRDQSALSMSPGLEGCLTVGVVGAALALSEGIAYATVVAITLPVLLLQFVACRAAGEPALAMLGLEGLVIGLFGLITPIQSAVRAAVSASPPPQRPQPQPQRRTPSPSRASAALG
jgi:hypothetical protein